MTGAWDVDRAVPGPFQNVNRAPIRSEDIRDIPDTGYWGRARMALPSLTLYLKISGTGTD